MAHRPADRIRNVALIGHRGSGKTSLCEALLFEAGVVNRLGRVEDGTTVSDFEPDEQEREMSIGASVASFEYGDRKINLIDTPGEPSFVADTLGRPARRRRRGGGRQRGDGGRGPHRAPLEPRRRRGPGPAGVRQHARPRARRLLPRARLAQGGVRPPRGRHRDPDRLRARGARGDRPDRHEGVRVRGGGEGQRHGVRDPRRPARPGRGVPREADGRGRGELRRADGALPRGRGDLPRGDRHGAQEGRHARATCSRSPAGWRPRTSAPTACWRRWSRTFPRRRCGARSRRSTRDGERDRDRARRGRRARRLRVQDHRRPLHRAGSTCCASTPASCAPTRRRSTSPARPRSGSASSPSPCGKETSTVDELGAGRHRRGRQAERDARRRRARGQGRRASRSRRSTCRRR